MGRLIIIVATILVMISHANAQERQLPFEEIQRVASGALSTLNELVTTENYGVMGFESPAEVRAVKLGEPLRVFMVRLDELQEYQPGSDPSGLLGAGDRVIYPVMFEEQARSSIGVGKVGERWVVTDFGSPVLLKMLTKVRKASSDATGLPISSYFVVQVPALNLYFVAHRASEGLMLTPLVDDPSYGFEAGITMPAEEVFTAILPAARAHEGLPG